MDKQNDLEELEKEMKKLRVDIVSKTEIPDDKFFTIEADIDCEVDVAFMKELVMTKKVMRGSIYYVTFENRKPGTLTMKIATLLSSDFRFTYAKAEWDQLGVLANTFMDLCWIHSEGTTSKTLGEVITEKREGIQTGDLTWTLPSKFIDDFVEMMHTLNQSIISGLMQDAIIYGPYILSKEDLV